MQIIGVLFAGLCFATWNAAAPYGPSKDQSSSPQSRGSCTVTGAPACSTGYRRKREPRLTCNFNSMPNSSSTAAAFNRLPMCHEVFQPGLPWINAAYHRYQFVRTDQSTDDIHEGEAALKSNCTRNIINYSNPSLSQMLIRPEEASASLQSGTFGFPFGDPSNRCARFFVSFWYRLNGRVVVADRTNPNRFYLEVLLHRVNEDGATGRPRRTVWGSNIADFALAAPNIWTRAQFDFTESDNFSLNFFAHHNDNCNKGTVRPIYLDSVETESELKECVPTIPPVPTVSTIPTASSGPNVPSASTVSGVPFVPTAKYVPEPDLIFAVINRQSFAFSALWLHLSLY
ncbi:hypothetical protein BV898_03097 [Hypsibius exemplaris]|uniref:MAM domain-containing protein n=1 Tax=Hypsibius exemplaris TaxID=2072580 RepID=A0A1W0X6A0_HYPEX|nr:hypothetical protein BV898_03097 [Hypsibius exemplaris]